MPLEKPTTTCPHCDTLNPSTAKFCLECGEKLEDIEVEEKEEESPREVEYIPPNDSASWREFCPVCNQRPLTIKTYKVFFPIKLSWNVTTVVQYLNPKAKNSNSNPYMISALISGKNMVEKP